MAEEERSLLEKTKSFMEDLLALKITESERLQFADDPINVFTEDISNQKPLRVAAVMALLFHLLLFLLMLPSFGDRVFEPTQEVLVLKQLAQPAAQMGGGPPEPTVPEPKPVETMPKPTPVVVPIPDPTPAEPEPIRKQEVQENPKVIDEFAADLNIGEITAPPTQAGNGRGQQGTGTGPAAGTGPGTGSDGVYTLGSGVTQPVPVVQTIPSYTDEAIKAKVQGVVLLQAIIRKDGKVTDFKVIRGLGYGLEEKAIEEIASNWKFRPGTRKGRPVDVLATIEVQFNLR